MCIRDRYQRRVRGPTPKNTWLLLSSDRRMSISDADLKKQLGGNSRFNVRLPPNTGNLEAIKRSAIPCSQLYWNDTGLVQRVAPPPPRIRPGQQASSASKADVPANEAVVEVKEGEVAVDQAKAWKRPPPVIAADARELPSDLEPVGKRDEEWRVRLEPWNLTQLGPAKPVQRMVASGMVPQFSERHEVRWNSTVRGQVALPEELVITGCATCDEQLFLKLNEKLQTIRLEDCTSLSVDAIARLAVVCPELRALCLEGTTATDDSVLASISQGCLGLQVLKIDGCELVTDSGVLCLQQSEQLLRLSMTRLPALTGRACFELLSPGLKEIDFSDCPLVTPDAVEGLVRQCKKLEVLSLKRCEAVDDAAMRMVSMCCPLLRTLCISGCHEITGRSLMQIASKLGLIESLEVSNLESFDDAVASTFVRNCKSLEKLDCKQCCGITNLSIVSMGTNARNLTHLSVSGCTEINNEAVDSFVDGFVRLSFLNLHGCSGIDTEEIGRIVKQRPSVEVRGNIRVEKKFNWTDLIGKDAAQAAAAAAAASKKGKKKKGKKKKKK
eukprot:TRINITY_DN6677_c0_g1_i2.p1 TRINITY_DN6677_c0_g1~~TRINITY_DN6677_c0_g1_i2.p1  ORF type:complete len:555 (+),score=156.81 TRINITY_DN6677_c0_g1_i2:105-1769(+)